uniref:Putative terminase n=1 Tax=viral metagenome TaxID=1070528 RepID=A0A6M3J062_9ZZZZ
MNDSIGSEVLSQISSKDTIGLEQQAIEANPINLLGRPFLSIKTKSGDLIKLRLNSTQRKLLTKINKLRAEKKRIRIWVLKYRQGGISTFIEALIYALTSQNPNRNSLIMADEKDKSDYLFQMSKLYHEELEKEAPYLTPTLKKSNAKSLEFEGTRSQIIIETAENPESARAFTYQYVHLSEVAFFTHFKKVMDGLNQSVPDFWDTIVIGETTANGMNEFYNEWIRAIEGKTDWIPMFFAWFEMEEYAMPLENGQLYPLKGIKFDADTSVMKFEQDEIDMKREFGLNDEQLNWRRWAIVNKCGGDLNVFRTEYPATWQEAFVMTGSLFFDRRGLERQLEKRPILIGELFYQNMKYEFREFTHGRIKVYEKPDPSEEYIVASDASEAIGSDEAAIVVLNNRLNTTAAIVVGQHAPEELAELDIALGNWYCTALVAPENKGYGYMVCQLVYQKYGNIYKRMVTKTGEALPTEELGFNTNSVTRPQMLAQMNEEIKGGTTELYAKEIIDECRTFIIKKDKHGNVTKVEAQDGFQDGLVICRAIAGMVRQQYPYKLPQKGEQHAKQKRAVEEAKKPIMAF